MAELIWSPRSLKDLELIFEYIRQDSVENARHFINELIQVTLTIPEYPFAGRMVPELRSQNIREKLYKSYRIIYRIAQQGIEVITLLHQAKRLIKRIYMTSCFHLYKDMMFFSFCR